MKNFEQWNGFKGNRWKEKIDVRNFIGMNYTPYDGDASFLEGPTEATNCGASSRHFRKKNVLKAEFLIWRQR